jgi:hypothetical protein
MPEEQKPLTLALSPEGEGTDWGILKKFTELKDWP